MNGHGTGQLDFFVSNTKTCKKSFNFQYFINPDGEDDGFLYRLNNKLKNLKKEIVLVILSCHIGQFTKINLMPKEISNIKLYTVASNFVLYRKDCLNILKHIEEKVFEDGTHWKVTLKDRHFDYESQKSEEYIKEAIEAYNKHKSQNGKTDYTVKGFSDLEWSDE